jgi:GNAT superfamily N-acetyltransferase
MRPSDVVVRMAAVADAETVASLLGELGYRQPAGMVQRRLATLTGDGNAVWVAELALGVVGVIAMHLVPTLHAPGCIGKITALVVSRESRARGVGTALVRAAENWARAQGAYRFEVVSGNHRPDAHRFYVQLGYRAPDQVRFTKDAGGYSD